MVYVPDRVEAVKEDVEELHPVVLHQVELDDVGVEEGPVDEGDEQRHRGKGDLEPPGHGVHPWEGQGQVVVRGVVP